MHGQANQRSSAFEGETARSCATSSGQTAPALIQHLHALASGTQRRLGFVGPTGAGKSPLASLMVQAVGERAQAVPMDSFHLAQGELERLGRAARKGTPDTFDAAGCAALLRRLRAQATGEMGYAPDFRREFEEPLAGARPVFPDTPLIDTECRNLVLNDDPWQLVVGLLDEVWHLQVEPSLRLERLAQRQIAWNGAQGPFTGGCPEGHHIATQAVFPQRNISPGEWVSCSLC